MFHGGEPIFSGITISININYEPISTRALVRCPPPKIDQHSVGVGGGDVGGGDVGGGDDGGGDDGVGGSCVVVGAKLY